MAERQPIRVDDNPLWYKDAILYELHVRAFSDANGDGIGDFRGLAEKLDYLQDLGVNTIWLLPFTPSPLKDDGYDTADYTGVHSTYGTLADFRQFVRAAHRRGLRVVIELVCNHTSDQHPWFQRARLAPAGSAARDFYVWSQTPERYRDARIIFKDFEISNWAWDPVAQAYYWHRFYAHQPDLNYDNPRVRKALLRVLDFWLKTGVDGLRLDAVPYLYEREGTSCENLPETHAFLKQLRNHVDQNFPGRMLLAEANQWPEDAVAYFGNDDECHMAFHFPLMPRLFMALRMEDRFPILDILSQTPSIPETAQWALFLRNHDELTLEMVTEEERDYMWRVYAQDTQARINLGIRRRLAPLLGNNRRRIELMNGLLFALYGTPVIYYGDEIGMGDNIYLGDRNGVRTPMQWSADRNAGFSRANRQRLYLPVIEDPEYHYYTVNVEAQQGNRHSLLSWMKRLIALRKRYRAFGRGTMTMLQPENRKVLAFLRQYENERILVVANLSRFSQYVELDLSGYADLTPVELFGETPFPRIGGQPFPLTLGPHAFFWFALEPDVGRHLPTVTVTTAPPVLSVTGGWESALLPAHRHALARHLGTYLQQRRWFGGKARQLRGSRLVDALPVPYAGGTAWIVLLQVDYSDGDPDLYTLALAHASGHWAAELGERLPAAVVARIQSEEKDGILYDALTDADFCRALLEAIGRRGQWRGEQGIMTAQPTPAFTQLYQPHFGPLGIRPGQGDQSNSSVSFGDRFILKLFRRVEEGIHPDLEVGRFLTERARFRHSPPVAGSLEYRRGTGEPIILAILQGVVSAQGDAWRVTLSMLASFYDQVQQRMAAVPPALPPPLPAGGHPLAMAGAEPPPLVAELVGGYLEAARLLGRRTAELHLALASDKVDPDFAPEPFTSLYQRSLYQSVRSLTLGALEDLQRQLPALPPAVQDSARALLSRQEKLQALLGRILNQRLNGVRIRCHGDYHLGQVLYTGQDFVIIDFEGEPARPLPDRRRKRSPLRDVAGMIRSFHYAAHVPLPDSGFERAADPAQVESLVPWARWWTAWVTGAFLGEYLAGVQPAALLPTEPAEVATVLAAHLLEKAIYELRYELGSRPQWVEIPLRGILEMIEVGGS